MNTMTECKKTMIHSYKGGCGKTSTAIGLAVFFAAIRNERVLLVEMDTICIFSGSNPLSSIRHVLLVI